MVSLRAPWAFALSLACFAASGCGPILYPAPQGASPTLPRLSPEVELLRLDAPGGEAVALFAPPADGRAVVVFFHGNGADIAGSEWLAAPLTQGGLGVLFVEYPGYGIAPGTPSEANIYAAAERSLEELSDRGVDASRVVLVGQSLGSAVAVEMALRGHGSRMLLISPFTSIPDLVDGLIPFGLGGVFATDRFDTFAKAPEIDLETVVAHGDADWLVPLEMGVAVAERIAGAELVIFEGGGHNDLFDREEGRLIRLIRDLAAGAAPGDRHARDRRATSVSGTFDGAPSRRLDSGSSRSPRGRW